jgi:hypothetical protein
MTKLSFHFRQFFQSSLICPSIDIMKNKMELIFVSAIISIQLSTSSIMVPRMRQTFDTSLVVIGQHGATAAVCLRGTGGRGCTVTDSNLLAHVCTPMAFTAKKHLASIANPCVTIIMRYQSAKTKKEFSFSR